MARDARNSAATSAGTGFSVSIFTLTARPFQTDARRSAAGLSIRP
jgi:hypothetical protein